MKQLQNNFTTPEQSKRLLELGVPAWTANIMFDKNRRRYELIETEDESLEETQRTLFYNGGAIPLWSVGRLIEIYNECCEDKAPLVIGKYDIPIQRVLIEFFAALKYGWIDFSKLEE